MKQELDKLEQTQEITDDKKHPVWLLFVYISLLTWTLWNLFRSWN